VTTIVVSKLPSNWHVQGCTMVYKVAYLVKAYNCSLPRPVVNGGERTCEPK